MKYRTDKLGRRVPINTRTREQWLEAITHDKLSYYGKPLDYSLLPEYVPSSAKVTVICPDHGTFTVTAHSHLKHGCPKCGRLYMADAKRGKPSATRMTVDKAVAKAQALWPDLDFSRVHSYTNNKDLWEVGCKKHGTWYKVKAINILYYGSNGCEECKKEAKLQSVYNTPVQIECPKHEELIIPRIHLINSLRKHTYLGNIESGNRLIIPPLELDLYIPRYNIAIEVNGVYYHNAERKSKDYHLDKVQQCQSKGIQLLHFTDLQVMSKTSLCLSMIHAKCGHFRHSLGARQTRGRYVDYQTAAAFLSRSHMQGSIAGSHYLALYSRINGKTKIVCLAVIGRPRFANYDWELLRFATLPYHQVYGGLSKIIAEFARHHKGETIVSYADLNYSNGAVYRALGWNLVRQSKPSFSWHGRNGEHYSRYQASHKNLSKILENYNPSKSQDENMKANGFWKIWDCGTLVYTHTL